MIEHYWQKIVSAVSKTQCKLNGFRVISLKFGGNSTKLAVPVAPVALALRMYVHRLTHYPQAPLE